MENVYIVWETGKNGDLQYYDTISRIFTTEAAAKKFKAQYDNTMSMVHGVSWHNSHPILTVKSQRIYTDV